MDTRRAPSALNPPAILQPEKMLKPEVFSEFRSNSAIKHFRDENQVLTISYGQLREAVGEVRKVIAENRLEEHYLGVTLAHSPALIAIISG